MGPLLRVNGYKKLPVDKQLLCVKLLLRVALFMPDLRCGCYRASLSPRLDLICAEVARRVSLGALSYPRSTLSYFPSPVQQTDPVWCTGRSVSADNFLSTHRHIPYHINFACGFRSVVLGTRGVARAPSACLAHALRHICGLDSPNHPTQRQVALGSFPPVSNADGGDASP